ncbi:T9SS type A sorting domain-containing protein [Pedobacter sp. R20-19]|uniref:T9SS type A sorting domain-containing protein n=1 Tax=Pedobacter sp. R20-19 TaxID=1270196 RepID=UPI0009EB57B1|nr:T9SS type A sorting domain-containing protein [Pedobacter sp. R20-19]
MIKLSTLLTISMALLCCNVAFGQLLDRSVIASAGESSTANNITLVYTIGEPVIALLENTTIDRILSTGFIQGDQVINRPFALVSRELAVYPNPTTANTVKLDLRNMPDGDYTVDIYDAGGRSIYSKSIKYTKDYSLNLDLDISQFKGGNYYIAVRNELIKGSVKLIKL